MATLIEFGFLTVLNVDSLAIIILSSDPFPHLIRILSVIKFAIMLLICLGSRIKSIRFYIDSSLQFFSSLNTFRDLNFQLSIFRIPCKVAYIVEICYPCKVVGIVRALVISTLFSGRTSIFAIEYISGFLQLLRNEISNYLILPSTTCGTPAHISI